VTTKTVTKKIEFRCYQNGGREKLRGSKQERPIRVKHDV